MQTKIPASPTALKSAGKRFWKQVQTEFDLDDVQSEILSCACVQLDIAAEARADIAKRGAVIADRRKSHKANPACRVEKDATAMFLRCCRALGLNLESSRFVRGPRLMEAM